MTKDTLLKNKTVIIRNNIIREISDKHVTSSNATIIDGKGKFLLPGLFDAHVHIESEDDFTSYLAYGVTGVFNMRGSRKILDWKEKINKKKLKVYSHSAGN